jgi:hypothetical protein
MSETVLILIGAAATVALGNAYWKLLARFAPPDPPSDPTRWQELVEQARAERLERARRLRRERRHADARNATPRT